MNALLILVCTGYRNRDDDIPQEINNFPMVNKNGSLCFLGNNECVLSFKDDNYASGG